MSQKQKICAFEDLIAWQKARGLTKAIYFMTQKDAFARDFGLVGQTQRAAVSIMVKNAEGFERPSLKEFLRFLATAKSSCAEVRSHLFIAHDVDYLTDHDFQHLNARAQEVSRIIGGLRLSLLKRLPAKSQNS